MYNPLSPRSQISARVVVVAAARVVAAATTVVALATRVAVALATRCGSGDDEVGTGGGDDGGGSGGGVGGGGSGERRGGAAAEVADRRGRLSLLAAHHELQNWACGKAKGR